MWPVIRAIFSIFFTHSLFEFINGKLQKSNSEYSWSPSILASIFVVVSIVSHVTSNLSSEFIGSPLTDIISIASFPILGWCLYKAQVAANIACNDPNGESNYKYSIANYIWIALGVIFWGLVILGIVMVDSY